MSEASKNFEGVSVLTISENDDGTRPETIESIKCLASLHIHGGSCVSVGQRSMRRGKSFPEIVGLNARCRLSPRAFGQTLGLTPEAVAFSHGVESVRAWMGYRVASTLCLLELASNAKFFSYKNVFAVLFHC